MRKGYIILEVLIAITILAVIIAATFSVIRVSSAKTSVSADKMEAVILAEQGVEVAHNLMQSDWAVNPIYEGVYHPALEISGGFKNWKLRLDAENGVNSRYTREIVVANPCRKGDGIIATKPSGVIFGTESTDIGDPCPSGTGSTKDLESRLITALISWKDREGARSFKTTLLVIDPDL